MTITRQTPRGVRLNNPGNIRHSAVSWKGQSTLQDDPDFVRFDPRDDADPDDAFWGIRAIMKIIINYQRQHDLETVRAIISRWAPPVENNTQAYFEDVAKRVGVGIDDHIDVEVPDLLIHLAEAIVYHENGKSPDPTLPYWFDETVYVAAAQSALT